MNLYTASQIAIATKKTRQTWWLLSNCRPTGRVPMNGAVADVWRWHDLPEQLRTEITSIAKARGFDGGEALIQLETPTWKSPIVFEQAGQFKERALKLKDALAAPLRQRHTLKSVELEELGLREYRRAFSCTIGVGDKQWWRLFERTLVRIGMMSTWEADELYLDAAAFRKPAPRTVNRTIVFLHPRLDDAIKQVKDRNAPSLEDRKHLFHAAFLDFENLLTITAPSHQSAMKLSIVRDLRKSVPGITKRGEGALKRSFNRTYVAWSNGRWLVEKVNGAEIETFIQRHPDAIEDQRRIKSGRPSYCCPPCEKRIKILTVKLRRKWAVAYRLLRKGGPLCEKLVGTGAGLCARCREHYKTFNLRRNKSYSAKSLQQRSRPNELEVAFAKGPRLGRMVGPHTPGDWSKVQPGDWFTADDQTSNHDVFHEFEMDGEVQRIIGKLQVLKMQDLVTGYPLGAVYYFGNGPTGRRVLQLIGHVARTIGLPRKGFLFENGPWRSKWITGEDKKSDNRTFLFRDSEAAFMKEIPRFLGNDEWYFGPPSEEQRRGIRDAGIKLRFCSGGRPQAKGTIECSFGIHQIRMAALPGFLGFNERLDKMELNQDFRRRAKQGKVHASAGMMSIDEYRENDEIVDWDIAMEPQGGRLRSKSPVEAWLPYYERHPLRKLPPELEYLVSTCDVPVTITGKGIALKINSHETAWYYNEHTGIEGRIGEPGWRARYDDNDPSVRFVTIYHERKMERFIVKRILLDKTTATAEELRDVREARKAHTAPARAFAKEVLLSDPKRHPVINTITRDSDYQEEAKALGRFHREEVAKARAALDTHDRKVGTVRRKAAAMGVTLGPDIQDPDGVVEALEIEKAALARLAEKERQL